MPTAVKLVTRSCNGGKGTFTQRLIPADTRILEFTGDRVVRELLIQAQASGGHDSFLQIAEDSFIGASGNTDDYVNHSCDPNCGLEFVNDRIYLKSIKPISRGEQLTFDYATSQQAFPFRFHCHCGSEHCRGEIGDYHELPDARKAYYESMGVIAPYLIQSPMMAKRRSRGKRVNPGQMALNFSPAFAPER